MAQADLALVDAQIAETDLRIREAAVYAPVAGTVITRKAYRGLVLGQGADPLFVMLRDDVLEIELEVSSADAGKLKLGMPVEIQILGDSALYSGKVRRTAGANRPSVTGSKSAREFRQAPGSQSRIDPRSVHSRYGVFTGEKRHLPAGYRHPF